MKIIFPQDPINEEMADPRFLDEVTSAINAQLEILLLDYDAIANQDNAARAVRHVPVHSPPITAIYRGWPLTVSQYTTLYDALFSRGVQLINTADTYAFTHHLPRSLPLLEGRTPHTIYMQTDGDLDITALMQFLMTFSGRAVIVRDYAQAEKTYWHEACYIPSSSDRQHVETVVSKFMELRGDGLAGGLVFREFIDLKPLGDVPVSGMPFTHEYRLFFLDGEHIATVHDWNMDEIPANPPPIEQFADVIKQVNSRFFTMDIAETTHGDWLIIELDDAQIAILPDQADHATFYQRIADITGD